MIYRYKFIGNLWQGNSGASAGVFIEGLGAPDFSNRETVRALIKKLNGDFAVITDFELYRTEEATQNHLVTDNKGVPLEVTVTTKAKYRLLPWEKPESEEIFNELALSA